MDWKGSCFSPPSFYLVLLFYLCQPWWDLDEIYFSAPTVPCIYFSPVVPFQELLPSLSFCCLSALLSTNDTSNIAQRVLGPDIFEQLNWCTIQASDVSQAFSRHGPSYIHIYQPLITTFPWASSCHVHSCLNVGVVSLKMHPYIAMRVSGLVIAPLCLTYAHAHIFPAFPVES